MTVTLVELCAGTASLSLWALGRVVPLTGYMGSKRRWAGLLTEALGADDPDRVVLVDGGPWGDVWTVLQRRELRQAVAEVLLDLDAVVVAKGTPAAWQKCLEPPSFDPVRRVAYFLWLQARSAGTIPVWWSGTRWESPTGARTEAAHARGNGTSLEHREKGRASRHEGPPYEAGGFERRREEGSRKAGGTNQRRDTRGGAAAPKGYGSRGIQRPWTIAQRILALDLLPWDLVEVVHGDVRKVRPIPGARVYFDPPYLGCPRYAMTLPRVDVLSVARRWSDAGCRVLVSESEPLPLDGWTMRRLPGKRREWVTASWPVVIEEQLELELGGVGCGT